MPSKLQAYVETAIEGTEKITSGYQSWTSFLSTAARFYKFPFLEQLMIHIQRPQATACAPYDLWRHRMRRYVRRGAKGIALAYMHNGQPALRYVFDVSDTVPQGNAPTPHIWTLRDEYLSAVSVALEAWFQVPQNAKIALHMADIATSLSGRSWNWYGNTLMKHRRDSPLEQYAEPDLGTVFRDATAASVTYMLLDRCALRPETILTDDDFRSVYRFRTYPTALTLGTAVSEAGQLVLRQIEKTIKRIETNRRPSYGISDSA